MNWPGTESACHYPQAAQYGKSFLSEMDPELFVSTCRYLRVLNSLRHHSHGMPLTMGQ